MTKLLQDAMERLKELPETLYNWADNTVAAQPPAERQALSNLQSELLGRTLAQLKVISPTQRQIYFVGFAGYGR